MTVILAAEKQFSNIDNSDSLACIWQKTDNLQLRNLLHVVNLNIQGGPKK